MIRVFNEHPKFEIFVDFKTFSSGERQVKIQDIDKQKVYKFSLQIYLDYRNSDDIIDLILVTNAIKNYFHQRYDTLSLIIPYFPFGRQDRICENGESNSLHAFCEIIKSLNFDWVVTYDPHSYVLESLLPYNLITIKQSSLFRNLFDSVFDFEEETVIVFPDSNAAKKENEYRKWFDNRLKTISCFKSRTPDGVRIKINESDKEILNDKNIWVCDDICDGGRTFIEVHREINRISNPKEINLYVTHGIFSHDSKQKLETIYDQIKVYFDRTENDFFRNITL